MAGHVGWHPLSSWGAGDTLLPAPAVTALMSTGQLWYSQFAEIKVEELMWFSGRKRWQSNPTCAARGAAARRRRPHQEALKLDEKSKKGKMLVFLVRFECQSFVVGKKLEVNK